MSSTSSTPRIARDSWASAIFKGTALFVVTFLLLVILPDRLLAYVAPRATPVRRDLMVAAVWMLSLVVSGVLFVVVQARREPR